MKYAQVLSVQPGYPQAHIITIEVDVTPGLFYFSIIGLGDTSVHESRERIISAIKHSGFASPKTRNQKIVALLAPSNIKKSGSIHDLAIAIGYLIASKVVSLNLVKHNSGKTIFLGELGLDGSLRKIKNINQAVVAAKRFGATRIFIPKDNIQDVALLEYGEIVVAESLGDCVNQLLGTKKATSTAINVETTRATIRQNTHQYQLNKNLARAILISLSGRHHTILFGEPGIGKTLASRVAESCLPPLTKEEYEECAGLYEKTPIIPIRRPHHSSSYAAIIGNSNRPGEIALAHQGLLILDEIAEFDRRTIESLREPMENSTLSLARAKETIEIPCDFTLIATTNMCSCGYFGSKKQPCRCSQNQIKNYQEKISGAMLDRIDIRATIQDEGDDETVDTLFMSARVATAREYQKERNLKMVGKAVLHKKLSDVEFWETISIKKELNRLFEEIRKHPSISKRRLRKIMAVARTIADLDTRGDISSQDIQEALHFQKNPFLGK